MKAQREFVLIAGTGDEYLQVIGRESDGYVVAVDRGDRVLVKFWQIDGGGFGLETEICITDDGKAIEANRTYDLAQRILLKEGSYVEFAKCVPDDHDPLAWQSDPKWNAEMRFPAAARNADNLPMLYLSRRDRAVVSAAVWSAALHDVMAIRDWLLPTEEMRAAFDALIALIDATVADHPEEIRAAI